jgi:hypothetical protein
MKRPIKHPKAKNQKEQTSPHVLFQFPDGYKVYNPATGAIIHHAGISLEEAEQFCQEKQIDYIVSVIWTASSGGLPGSCYNWEDERQHEGVEGPATAHGGATAATGGGIQTTRRISCGVLSAARSGDVNAAPLGPS